MTKKKLKLKSVKKIKESIKEETQKAKKKEKKKKVKKEHHFGRVLLMLFIIIGIGAASVSIAFSLYIVFTSPEFNEDKLYVSEVSKILWDDGSEMAKYGKENIVLKNFEDFPQVLIDALVATEDSRFFQHSGFDAARFLKATIDQVLGKSGAGGASTLTMQIVKNNLTSLDDEGIKGIIRKFTDIYMAVFQIEKRYTKEQIIEMYFNSGWFANGGTNSEYIGGIEQGSQYFFGKTVSDLSLPEAAMMVGMYNAPNYYNPYLNPENCEERKDTVLSLMYRHGYITEQEMLDAQNIHVSTLVKPQDTVISSNPYQVLIEYVVKQAEEDLGINIYNGGFIIQTTFNKQIQDVINAMQNGAAYEFRDDLLQVGSAVISVSDGSIKGIGPGRNYAAGGGTNRATEAQQPGSTIKPLIDYGPLIEYNNASTGMTFLDVKYGYNDGTYIYNFDGAFKNFMVMKDALSQSRNIPALQAFHQVDPNKIKEFLNNLGIDASAYGKELEDGVYEDKIFEAFAVGGLTHGLTPIQSAAAYATFARGGYYIKPYCYYSVKNIETEETVEYKYEKTKAMSEATAYMITDILIQATREGVAGSINSSLRPSIASKSGTTNISAAAARELGVSQYATPYLWVNSYNADYSISMRLGYDKLDKDHYLTSGTGSGPRGKIASYLANNILTSKHGFTKPSSVVSVTIEKNSLPTKRASEYTPDNFKYQAYFKAGTEPTETSTRFTKLTTPENASATVKEKNITITWDAVDTPAALDTGTVRSELEEFYKDYKSRYSWSYAQFENAYMDLYAKDNTTYIGTFGYQVYLKDENGNLKNLGWTQNNTYNYTATSDGTYNFVIKSSYSIFKNNESDGIEVSATVLTKENPELEAAVESICVPLNSTFNPKDAITVFYDGKDVTEFATVIASVDTSKEGEFAVTYSVTYDGQTVKVNGKVTIQNSCPEN